MPLKSGKLTRPERVFSEKFAATGDAAYAGAKAGYGSNQATWAAMQRPAVQEEIRRAQIARMYQQACPLAVDTLCAIMGDERQPAGARVQAAKISLDYTLRDPDGGQSKEPHEMTPDELAKELQATRLRLAAVQHVAADRAKPVIDHETGPEPGIFD